MNNSMRTLVAVAILAVSCTSKVSEERLNTQAVLLRFELPFYKRNIVAE